MVTEWGGGRGGPAPKALTRRDGTLTSVDLTAGVGFDTVSRPRVLT